MKFIKYLLIILGSAIVLFGIISILLPSKFEIQVSTVINKPAYISFELVNNIKNWEKWSPWNRIDQNMKMKYSGHAAGVGSSFNWLSNNGDIGSGQTICSKSEPYNYIEYNMTFAGHDGAISSFSFEEFDNSTTVTWRIIGELGFFYRWMGLVLDFAMLDFLENGVKNLKEEAELQPNINLQISESEIDNMQLLAIRDSTSHNDIAGIGFALESSYSEIMSFIQSKKLQIAGPPISINIEWERKYVFDAAIPIEVNLNLQPTGRIKFTSIESGKVVKGIYKGPYDKVAPAYSAIHAFIKKHNLTETGYSWEEYINEPSNTSSDSLITIIYFPVK